MHYFTSAITEVSEGKPSIFDSEDDDQTEEILPPDAALVLLSRLNSLQLPCYKPQIIIEEEKRINYNNPIIYFQ